MKPIDKKFLKSFNEKLARNNKVLVSQFAKFIKKSKETEPESQKEDRWE